MRKLAHDTLLFPILFAVLFLHQVCHSLTALSLSGIVNPLPHGDANRHTIFKRKK